MLALRPFLALWAGYLAAALAAALVCGCAPCRPDTVAPASRVRPCLDRSTLPDSYPEVAPTVAAALELPCGAPTGPAGCPCPPLNVLVLSGGGKFGTFTAGVLVGWSEAGTRPTFDVITGISSGALEAAFVFLGPKYDSALRRFACCTRSTDLFSLHPCLYLLTKGSVGSSRPIERLIDSIVDDDFLAGLRHAHAAGRRLFVGTCALQSRRLVVWDLGALASSSQADAPALIRKILLAAVSVPGLVPPVTFDVEINGRCYREEHCDGGSAALAFVRFGPVPGWPRPGAPARNWLAGSNLFVLTAGKLYSDPVWDKMGFVRRVQGGLTSCLHALQRGDLARLHALCAVSGMRFHLVAIPQEIEVSPSTMSFDPCEMQRLFNLGYQMGKHGIPWRHTPPEGEPGEEPSPRTGLRVDAP
jgi:hypothetical protein